ncbi:MAG: AAA family ATPase [Limnochordia bacterium]|jgi:pilus assembly protein CpaE
MGEQIRVLIADDIEETRVNVARLLEFERDLAVVAQAGDGQEAVELALEHRPDCILMDINMPVLDGIAATERISMALPETVIIMMSVQGEQDYLRQAMLAGAREYLIKPFSGDELVHAVKSAVALERRRRAPRTPAKPGKIITVFSPKGGVGKTLIATNLAASLAAQGQKTVVVDLDLQFGDQAIMLDLQPSRTISDLVGEAKTLDLETVKQFLTEHKSGLQLLAAPLRPEEGERVPGEKIRAILQILQTDFEYIIVDTAQGFTEGALQAMEVGDELLMVSTLDVPTIKNVKLAWEILASLGQPLEKTQLIFNRCCGEGELTKDMVRDKLPLPVLAWLPVDEVAALRAANRGEPLVGSGDKGKLTQGLEELVAAISGDPSDQEAPVSFRWAPLRKLFHLARG